MRWLAFSLSASIALGAYGIISAQKQSRMAPACAFCERPTGQATSYRIKLSFGRTREACCARCGIRYQKERPGAARAALARDFGTERKIDARRAVYVEGSDYAHSNPRMIAHDQEARCFVLCYDRCCPSLVAFADHRSAERFVAVHSGTLRSFDHLLQEP